MLIFSMFEASAQSQPAYQIGQKLLLRACYLKNGMLRNHRLVLFSTVNAFMHRQFHFHANIIR